MLLAEDDAASRSFLSDALTGLGWHVTACADGVQALALARATTFDLLLLDRRLPGLGASAVLAALRADPSAASRHTTAFASSAEWLPTRRAEAAAAGFATLVDKPLTVADLAALVAPWAAPAMAVRDDAGGLTAAGNAGNLAALRKLFSGELERMARDVAAADPVADAAWRERLHRLCASAGFCGAPALAAASRAWLQALRDDRAGPVERARFIVALDATRAEFTAP